jgi:hypothetical protein
MHRLFTILIVIFVFFIPAELLFGQNASEEPARILAINLYPGDVDLELARGETIAFSQMNLSQGWTTTLKKTKDFGKHFLYFRSSSQEDWMVWVDADGDEMYCSVNPGQIFIIIVRTDGTLGYYSIKEENTDQPQLIFVNASNKTMSRMEVSKKWMTGAGVYANDLKPNHFTNFVKIEEGTYKFRWHAEEYGRTYYTYSDPEAGQAVDLQLYNNNYYIFGAITIKGDEQGFGYNITPLD